MKFADLIDHLDAEVFTGDMLYDDMKRESLQLHIQRWQSAINNHLLHQELSPDELCLKYGDNGHPEFGLERWREEVIQDHTQRGYWDWVAAQIEEAAHDTVTDNSPALYIKVHGGVVQAVAVRGIDLGDKQLEVIVDDLDSAEEDGRPDLIAFNGGEVPKEFVFIW